MKIRLKPAYQVPVTDMAVKSSLWIFALLVDTSLNSPDSPE